MYKQTTELSEQTRFRSSEQTRELSGQNTIQIKNGPRIIMKHIPAFSEASFAVFLHPTLGPASPYETERILASLVENFVNQIHVSVGVQ